MDWLMIGWNDALACIQVYARKKDMSDIMWQFVENEYYLVYDPSDKLISFLIDMLFRNILDLHQHDESYKEKSPRWRMCKSQ